MNQTQRATIVVAALGLAVAVGALGQDFDLSWYTVDGGGMTSTGGNFELSGTIGQPDAGPVMAGGNLTITGGFWFVPQLAADCDGDADVDLFDYNAFQGCYSGPDVPAAPECECFDLDGDGDVDLLDWRLLQAAFTG